MTDKLFNEMCELMNNAYEEGLREHFNIPSDWKFFDSPYISDPLYEIFINMLNNAETRFVSGSKKDGATRVTMFISPQGVENIRKNNS